MTFQILAVIIEFINKQIAEDQITHNSLTLQSRRMSFLAILDALFPILIIKVPLITSDVTKQLVMQQELKLILL